MKKRRTMACAICLLMVMLLLASCNQEKQPTESSEIENMEMTQEEIVALYNQELQRILSADSYTFSGYVSGTASVHSGGKDSTDVESSSITTDMVTRIAHKNGKQVESFEVEGNYGTSHRAYMENGVYYYDVEDVEPYRTSDNTYSDFDLSGYFLPIKMEEVVGARMEKNNGVPTATITIPLKYYQADIIFSRIGLGGGVSEENESLLILTLAFDEDMQLSNAAYTVDTYEEFGEDYIDESVSVYCEIYDINDTTVTTPEDLEQYETEPTLSEEDMMALTEELYPEDEDSHDHEHDEH